MAADIMLKRIKELPCASIVLVKLIQYNDFLSFPACLPARTLCPFLASHWTHLFLPQHAECTQILHIEAGEVGIIVLIYYYSECCFLNFEVLQPDSLQH